MSIEPKFPQQMKDKLNQVFSQQHSRQTIHPFQGTVILALFTSLPSLDYFRFKELGHISLIQWELTAKFAVVALYAGFLKRRKRFRSRAGPSEIIALLTLAISCISLVALCFAVSLKTAEAIAQRNCNEHLAIVAVILVLHARFSLQSSFTFLAAAHMLFAIRQLILASGWGTLVSQIVLATAVLEAQVWQSTQQEAKRVQIEEEVGKMCVDEPAQSVEVEQETKSQINLRSRANELLNKLRLLKYQELIGRNDNLNRRGSRCPSNIQTVSLKHLPMTEEVGQAHQQPQEVTQFQGRKSTRIMTSITDYQISNKEEKNSSPCMTEQHINSNSNKHYEEAKLTIEEIDDLLNLLSGRKEVIWLPHFLRSSQMLKTNDNEFSQDAKKFLLSHFTQREASFKYIDDYINEDHEIELVNTIDFNFDFLQANLTSTPVNQTRFFLENSFSLFKKFRIAATLKIDGFDTIRNFNVKLESLYRYNLYHNSMHAIDVANSTAFFLENGLLEIVDEFDAACLILSSLAHDVGHPGLNNGFMISNRCRLALLYNDQSVLENYHSFLFFQILQQEQFNITSNLATGENKGFRKYCLNLILDTDLTRHFPLMNKFQNYLDLQETQQPEPDKLLIMSICIKCADVGHGAKSLQLHKQWSRRIIEEFFMQGDLEKYLRMPVSPMCDRSQPVAKSQEGFLKAIVLPMFHAFSTLLQNDNVKNVCIKQIHENIEYWQGQPNDDQFNEDTQLDINPQNLENLKKFLDQPLQISV